MNKSKITAILGLQYGDEGKGKFTDLLATKYDYIVRYQGGDNAGHSIVFNSQRYALRIIPSGIFNQKKVVIGNGCVVNPATLLNEIKYLELNDFSVKGRLFLSDKAHLILDYNIAIDKLNELNRGANKIGTTCKGIGPTYADKAARIGIRVCDLFNYELLKTKIEYVLKEKNLLFAHYQQPLFDATTLADKYFDYGKQLSAYISNTSHLLNQAIKYDSSILLEGAQGVLLDIDHGTYPYVTSSNVATGMSAGSGIGITKINHVLGVVKAYTSRVGEGPFCSEMHDVMVDKIRIKGHEFGTVTKRPRRIGWIDIVALKEAINISGTNEIAITLLDVLSIVDDIKICVKYKYNNQLIEYIPSTQEEYYKCEPVFITLPGWKTEIDHITDYEQLPVNCINYVKKLAELLETKISYVSVGPDRTQTIEIK